MKNRLLVFAIALGGIFLSAGIVKAKTITCRVMSPSDFKKETAQPLQWTYNWWYWDPETQRIEAHFNEEMEGVFWHSATQSQVRSVVPQRLTQIPYPVTWVSQDGRPVCIYHLKFDDEKEGLKLSTYQIVALPKFYNCRVTGQTTFDCQVRAQ
jgi:hypothetical protein